MSNTFHFDGGGLFFLSSVSLTRLCLPLSDAFAQIISTEGVGVLWNGTLPSLILVLNPAVHLMFYEAMKRRVGRGGRKVRGGLEGSESAYQDKDVRVIVWVLGFGCSPLGPVNVTDPARLPLFFVSCQISSAEIFVIGAIAKAIAATSTYPLQTVQTILRVKTNLTDMFYCCQKPLADNSCADKRVFH